MSHRSSLKFFSFKKARLFARSQKLNSREAWLEYSKSGRKPNGIPATPYLVYKNEGWISWGDWLGTGVIASQKKDFRTFKKALVFARSLKLGGFSDWMHFCKSGNRPKDIPSSPNQIYKNKGWTSWGDWLGTSNVAPQKRTFQSFKMARSFAQSLKLTAQSDWKRYCKSACRPYDIPAAPHKVYNGKGWKSWGDWLGSGNIATQSMKAQR
ncbi:integrase repeat-containing protein [Candidatus Berkiella aquae]|uniref:Uncharacterized protein n=1 Tax=Candidatus Berkiella aquae TaxID=295108 RepID=A0A0Q9YI82_9GAMM|nr:integrase repeat-containing protein [Candidatus Berkiella aquae]MCS5712780.1 hypothetical protein [Candidatus Berkiella aquae]